MNYNVLCISGGGMKGISMLGSIHYIHDDKDMLSKIDTYIGTSIGSVIALLLCIGYSPMEIFTRIQKIDKFLNIDILNFFNFKNHYGLLDINQFTNHVEKSIKQKLSFVPTLKELYDFCEKRLIVTVTNYTDGCSEYLDYESDPNLSVLEAIKMSCALPIIFDRIEYKNKIYVDGGIGDNCPILHASKFGNVICIRVVSLNSNDDILSYIHRLFSVAVHKIEKMQIELVKNAIIIDVDSDSKSIDIKDSKDKRMTSFCQGYGSTKKYFSDLNNIG